MTEGKVVLEKTEGIFYRLTDAQYEKYWQPRSYVQVRVVCMLAAGWKNADYETIMTLSGFGPSFSYHPQKFWAQYHAPRGCDERITQATGFGWEWKRCETAEEYWQALKETINAGRPVHAPYYEEVLFVGYRDAADKAGRKVRPLAPHGFVDPDTWWSWDEFEKWFKEWSHNWLGRHTTQVVNVTARASAIDVMETIVRLAKDDPRAENPDFADVKWGLEGLEAYAADVADTSKSGVEGEYFHGGWLGCHNIYPQISGRASAAAYLKRLGESGFFSKEATDHILVAVEKYRAARAAWGEYEKHLGNEKVAEVEDGWTTEKRRLAGAAAIRQAIEYERAAIDQLGEALAVIQ